jgi:DNA-binding NarL/FixJ family response regulator
VGLHGNSGLDLLKNMHAVRPELPVLAISMHDEMLFAERVLRAGGRGYLMKHAGLDLLLLAIRKVLAGGIYLSDRASGNILTSLAGRQDKAQGSDRISCLTDREFEIFRLMGQGLEPHAVAAQLHISVKTIDTHRSHIREKLGLKNSTELIHFATRWLNEQR